MDSGPALPESAPVRPLLRLAVALGVSVLLHAALILGVRLEYSAHNAEQPLVIYARLAPAEPAPPAPAPPAPAPAAAPPAPEPVTPARPEPPSALAPEPPAQAAEAPAPAPAAEPARTATAPAPQAPATPTPAKEERGGPAIDVPLLSDPTWYSRNEVDVGPKALSPVSPVFPEEAARQGVTGYVKLMLAVDEAGRVREVDVVEAQPEGWFEDAAKNAFEEARFSPARKQGRAVRSRIVVQVRFELGR